MWRVDFEVDGLPVDALVVARYSGCLVLDFALDLLEVVEPSSGNVIELAPFILSCDSGWCVWDMYFVLFGLVASVGGEVDELEDEWSSGDDTTAARKEVSTDDVFEDG